MGHFFVLMVDSELCYTLRLLDLKLIYTKRIVNFCFTFNPVVMKDSIDIAAWDVTNDVASDSLEVKRDDNVFHLVRCTKYRNNTEQMTIMSFTPEQVEQLVTSIRDADSAHFFLSREMDEKWKVYNERHCDVCDDNGAIDLDFMGAGSTCPGCHGSSYGNIKPE